MTVCVVLTQPDGDWDHLATLYGVYTTKEAAERRQGPNGKKYGIRVIEVETDTDLDTRHYA